MAIHQPLFRVVYADGGWTVVDPTVVDPEDRRLSPLYQTEGDAVVRAKELANDRGGAQIVVHGEDGRVLSDFMHQPEQRHLIREADETASTTQHMSWPATRRSGPPSEEASPSRPSVDAGR